MISEAVLTLRIHTWATEEVRICLLGNLCLLPAYMCGYKCTPSVRLTDHQTISPSDDLKQPKGQSEIV